MQASSNGKINILLAMLTDHSAPNLFGVTIDFDDPAEMRALAEAAGRCREPGTAASC